MDLAKNKAKIFKSVEEAAEAENNTQGVNVIAVTKYVEAEVAHQLVEVGVRHIGENRVDKFLEKYHALAGQPVTWHLIGSLQRRKVKDVINLVDYFHALDSVKLAKEINKRADHSINCFLQVNLSEEPSKHGFLKNEIEEALLEIAELPNINLVGLMTMAPLKASQAELEALFDETYRLKENIKAKNIKNMPMTDLSMGISGDYLVAIKHGATFVRIGTAFFQ
ncbi:YggS family pyridoxal phosphate-dependent enzyme [Streptococcus thoraltensis]|uniref:YggS family pyridoxal phosphate-dependent enzyme n=1 Tax=Streptococcus thoraltensis TaxID=55085 RepID=UPI001F582DC1|nr:YggS family pyridoxal phosphate-dependent enzyme [Streptococcus thoraltensis]